MIRVILALVMVGASLLMPTGRAIGAYWTGVMVLALFRWDGKRGQPAPVALLPGVPLLGVGVDVVGAYAAGVVIFAILQIIEPEANRATPTRGEP